MTNIKILERTIVWLNDIADMCQRLTTGNVSHLGATIRGKAVRAAEFINKHKEVYVSTELKEIAHKVQEATWKDNQVLNAQTLLITSLLTVPIGKRIG